MTGVWADPISAVVSLCSDIFQLSLNTTALSAPEFQFQGDSLHARRSKRVRRPRQHPKLSLAKSADGWLVVRFTAGGSICGVGPAERSRMVGRLGNSFDISCEAETVA